MTAAAGSILPRPNQSFLPRASGYFLTARTSSTAAAVQVAAAVASPSPATSMGPVSARHTITSTATAAAPAIMGVLPSCSA